MSDDDGDMMGGGLFNDESFYKPEPEPTLFSLPRDENSRGFDKQPSFDVKLIGKHSLWADHAWNAGNVLATKVLDMHPSIVEGKTVLELGCGAGFPSYAAAINGASVVVATDYPDKKLIDMLQDNVNTQKHPLVQNVFAEFDVIFMADLIFNHFSHYDMLNSLVHCLKDDGKVYVLFSHHRPHYADRDMDFFRMAKEEYNLKIQHLDPFTVDPMFENDPGSREVRSTVHYYIMEFGDDGRPELQGLRVDSD